MLRIRRTFEAPELGVRVDSHLALSARHRVVAGAVVGNVVFDATLLPREPPSSRSYVYVVLAGTLQLRRAAIEVPAGTLLVAKSRDTFTEQRWIHDTPCRILALQFDPALLRLSKVLSVRPMSDVARAAALALHRALSSGASPQQFARAHRAFLRELRRLGIPLAAESDGLAPPTSSARERVLSDALSDALSLSGTLPALVDIAAATRLSERSARRFVPELAKSYGFAYASWRSLRRAWSTVIASILLTSPVATPAVVCRLTGFAGPASLCHALRRAGLPSPRALQRRARLSALAIDFDDQRG